MLTMQLRAHAAPIDPSRPFAVTAPGGMTKLLVMNRSDAFPVTFGLMATTAKRRVAIRVSGGCKGMSPGDKAAMLEYFGVAFHGYEGMIWSGGTRQVTDSDQLDPMVTDVPGVIAAGNPDCVALGSAPRTDIMRLKGDSRLVFDEGGTAPNPSMSAILVVQNGPDGKGEWDGDVAAAFELMTNLANHANFSAVGVVAWNGGAITTDEIMRSAKAGWPTIVIKGSGRAADEIAGRLEDESRTFLKELPKDHKVVVADRNDPTSLRALLTNFGFLTAN
jgi:hypothetical protein